MAENGLNTVNRKPEVQSPDRRSEILEVAAQLFAERGYRGTSIRDIADRVGMLPGSLYYHITSKEALFVEIHDKAIDAAAHRVLKAMEPFSDPWKRLEAACGEMLDLQLSPEHVTLPIMNNLHAVPDDVRDALVRKRDDYEMIFRRIVDDLPLPAEIDRSVYRIFLLKILNTAESWYREGRLSRKEITAQIVAIFRR